MHLLTSEWAYLLRLGLRPRQLRKECALVRTKQEEAATSVKCAVKLRGADMSKVKKAEHLLKRTYRIMECRHLE